MSTFSRFCGDFQRAMTLLFARKAAERLRKHEEAPRWVLRSAEQVSASELAGSSEVKDFDPEPTQAKTNFSVLLCIRFLRLKIRVRCTI